MRRNLTGRVPAVGHPSAGHPLTSKMPFTDADLTRLQSLLDALPAPLQPLDVSALDGYLCGVLLQPKKVPAAQWLRHVADLEGRAPPPGVDLEELHTLVHKRHAELDQAIGQRQWFDPFIYQLEDGAGPSESVLPWVAGFAAAGELFPALMALDHPDLVEPLALLFMHFDEDDLEDADALIAVIQTLEPPADLAEAVQDVVRALMLIADVTRPRAAAPGTRGGLRPRPKPTHRRPR
jgi:uncharacterized protein